MRKVVKEEHNMHEEVTYRYREYSDGFWIKNQYDENGNETYCETSDGEWAKYEYDENGIQTYCENSDGKWEKYEYDANGNEIYCETSYGYWKKNEYDANGNKIYWENSDGCWAKYEYDENGNLIYWETNDGHWRKKEFGTNGKIIYLEDSFDGVKIDKRKRTKAETMINHSFYNQLLTMNLYKDDNKCPYYDECNKSMHCKNKLKFYRTRIGSNYDNEQIKIMVVGQEDVGEGKEYSCCEPCTMEEAGYNPHYLRTFYTVAQILLDSKDLPKGFSKKHMSQSKFEDLRHSFALTNYYKCVFSDDNKNSGVKHSEIMEKYCSKNLLQEIEILKPDIVIIQGKQGKNHKSFWQQINWCEVENTKKNFLIENKNYELGLYQAKINSKTFFIIDSYHPTSYIWTKDEILEYFIQLLKKSKELCQTITNS